MKLAKTNHCKGGIAMPLTLAVVGEEVIIKRIGGNADVRAHLQNLGFVSGAAVTVVSSMGGNLIVNVKNARIAVSKEIVDKQHTILGSKIFLTDDKRVLVLLGERADGGGIKPTHGRRLFLLGKYHR